MKPAQLLFILFFLFTFCKKTEIKKPEPLYTINVPIDSSGGIDLHIMNVIDSLPLILHTKKYTSANNDTFIVDELLYYISNVELKTTNNTIIKQKESYYLTNQNDLRTLELEINKVPRGNYKSISFLIGVDSVRNFSGAQTGALDPALGMIWSWNTGYIMAKLEGSSPQSSESNKKIVYHIGGFSGALSGVKKVTLNFPINVEVKKNRVPIINLNANIALWFSGHSLIDFASTPAVTTIDKNSSNIARNYQNMFQIKSIIN